MNEEQMHKAEIAVQVVQADPLMLKPEVLEAANAVLLAYLAVPQE